jgi:DNA polymerase V
MGVPVFQVQDLVKQHNIQLFSSNYTLYADMSARVMSILEGFAPSIEIYSIDESFLDLTGVCEEDPIAYGQTIRKTVLRATGIPVCVGMAQTKTLAKLANYGAKKWKHTNGVLDLSDPDRREKFMKLVPVGEVWGIGSRTTAKLNQPSKRIQTQFNVMVARTVLELNGIGCMSLEEVAPDKQQIVCSRSFSKKLTDYKELSEALAEYCTRAAEKLRHQQSVTGCISVFIRTNLFNPSEPQYQRSASIKLSAATQDTRTIITTANRLLKELYKPNYKYHKCGVQLSHIQPAFSFAQDDLFDLASNPLLGKSDQLMQTFDQINRRFPKSIAMAASGFDKTWIAKAERETKHYTTDWNELVDVKCG